MRGILRCSTPIFACAVAIALFTSPFSNKSYGQSDSALPPLPELNREFRGVWVATVANIDWPTKPGLSTEEQKSQAIDILDRCQELGLNVIVLQVRTSCDALYRSDLEPWSYYLTGEQGQAPEPMYDPLDFWIEQTHLRGMELHAWFNPYRARNSGQKYTESPNHISNSHPELVKRYGNDKTSYLWLDPGETKSREHTLSVFLDVVKRYDVDGIHIDDYFYPYPIDDIPFPDDPAWEKYLKTGGKLGRDDWRRDQMNQFIKTLYHQIKATKPHVKFGISPFGIWKPGYPASVQGFNQYEKLYADAKLWLNEGWCDYYSPQLYWPIHAKQQSFPALLQWWIGENTKSRTIAPGIFTSRIGDKNRPLSVEQIEDQVFLARTIHGSSGTIHFSMKAIMENREGLSDRLKANTYLTPALTPLAPWLSVEKIPAAKLSLTQKTNPSEPAKVEWEVSNPEALRRWCVYRLVNDQWECSIVGAKTRSLELENSSDPAKKVRAIAVRGVDGSGALSPASILAIE
jgi:uncharacterized lipoprotein YddW (UPF0748 family)